MKLSLIFEMDRRLSDLLRHIRAEPGDVESLEQAMRMMERSRNTKNEFEAPSISKQTERLRPQHPERNYMPWQYDQENFLYYGYIQLGIEWDMTQVSGVQEATYLALDLLKKHGYDINSWDIENDMEGRATLGVDIEDSFVERLIEEDYIELRDEDGKVIVRAERWF